MSWEGADGPSYSSAVSEEPKLVDDPLHRLRRQHRAPPAGFEPATVGLEVRCTVRLSYGGGLTSLGRRPQTKPSMNRLRRKSRAVMTDISRICWRWPGRRRVAAMSSSPAA